MKQTLEYINKGRGGFIVYKDNESEFKMEFEYGGGNCVAIIYIPKADLWESKTNISIENRQQVLDFIAQQSIKDQAPNSTFTISKDCIEIFQNKTMKE